jgi:hypothetical protein
MHLVPCLVALGLLSAADPAYPLPAGFARDLRMDFGAIGDGVADDTAALRSAIGSSGVVYVPPGTYRCTGPVLPATVNNVGAVLWGHARDQVIIRLADGTTGFSDPTSPAAFIRTVPTAIGSADYFRRGIHHLTIDTGNNPGATALQFYSNNTGLLENVRVRGNGPVGLDLKLALNGPLLVREVDISGFDTGVLAGGSDVNSQTMDGVIVRNCDIGLDVNSNTITARRLDVEARSSAVRATTWLTLVDSILRLDPAITGSVPAAITDAGGLRFIRNITVSGYSAGLRRSGVNYLVNQQQIQEYTRFAVEKSFADSPDTSLALPVDEVPAIAWHAANRWLNVATYGAVPGDGIDDTAAIQAAMNAATSKRCVVGFPSGVYTVSGTLNVPRAVRRLHGCNAVFSVPAGTTTCVWSVSRSSGSPLVVEGFFRTGPSVPLVLRLAGTNTTVVRSSVFQRIEMTAAGTTHLVNVVAKPVISNAQHRLFARQLNSETSDTAFENAGGTAWVLGYKTESNGIRATTSAGGRTEMLGALIYQNAGATPTVPMFIVDEAQASFHGVRQVNYTQAPFTTLVRETRGGITATFPPVGSTLRHLTSYIGYPTPMAPTAAQ